MKKEELRELVKSYFNLQDIETPENINNEEVVEQNFAEANLADGTKVTNMVEGDFAVGQVLHVILEDGTHVNAPEGSHTTESGIELVVDAEGILTGVKYPDVEGEGSLEEMSSEEVEAEATEDKTELAEEIIEEEIMEEHGDSNEDIKEAIIEAIMGEIAPRIEELEKHYAEHEEKLAIHEDKMKEHMSATPASESVTAKNNFSKKASFNKGVSNVGPVREESRNRYERTLNFLNNKK
jgi:hypothetical protein